MQRTLIKNATIVNEGRSLRGSVVIGSDGNIESLPAEGEAPATPCPQTIDATGCYLLPGVIDEHVHFREPGLTQKADILCESRAAAAGGVTSIMDMPNTNPQTTTLDALAAKQELLNERCIVNHSCYYGATNTNYRDFARLDGRRVCGIKLFMGSSTGNMLVDQADSLMHIFDGTDLLIATHCEDQAVIAANSARYRERFATEGDGEVPLAKHPAIRSAEACYRSTHLAVELARKTGARLHVMHLSTARELALFSPQALDGSKRITAEACVAHLLFTSADYRGLGARIKCNPAVKRRSDREALRAALQDGRIDTIATDHAPHLLTDKAGGALRAASGMPMVQFSLPAMLDLASQGVLSMETLVEKMCHAPARLYRMEHRGYIRPGYRADLVLVRPSEWTLSKADIRSKCGWSPLEGYTFGWRVERTIVNGHTVYDGTTVDDTYRGEELLFCP